MTKHIAPAKSEMAFTCPHCGVLARQYKWGYALAKLNSGWFDEQSIQAAPLTISRCEHCGKNCLWMGDEYVYPPKVSAPPPNPDMPGDVLADYQEAARIAAASPRGAAALLRLAVQKLMAHLGQPGKNINSDIAALVADGLPRQVQQALDVVRVIGNNAVHPGQIDANDTAVAQQLFPLLNVIVEYRISLPQRVNAMYNALPPNTLDAIEKRDKPNP